MSEHIALGMIVGSLIDAFHRLDFRQEHLEQSRGVQQFKTFSGSPFRQDSRHFVADPFPRNQRDRRS